MKRLSELMDLRGRVALISGGAGHIGNALADSLAELGCAVCLLDRNEETLALTANRLRADWNVRADTLVLDLEDEAGRATVTAWVQDRFGRLDILVNNAGFVGDNQLQGWAVALDEQRIDTWRRAMEVNLTAVFHLSQVLSPLLRASGKGSIVNIGSIYGVVGPDLGLYAGTGMGNPAAYAASKGGLIQLTRWLSTVLAPEIRVNCVSPGGVFRNQPEAFVARYVARTPMRRMGVEDDFKGAVAYLASDLSGYVTGQNLKVDGGWTVW